MYMNFVPRYKQLSYVSWCRGTRFECMVPVKVYLPALS